MKKIIYLIFLCLTLAACNDWLTVEPKDQISEPDLYATANGYYNELNGIYKKMAEKELYGQEMTWGLVDVLAQYYINPANWSYKNAWSDYNYSYAPLTSLIDNIWTRSFNIIANCSDLIVHAEQADTSLFIDRKIERDMILGEAHALRAYLHFDMLRLYAPAPMKNDNNKWIPYVETFPTHIPMKLTTKEVLEKCIVDLEKGHELTLRFDTTFKGQIRTSSYRLELSSSGGMERSSSFRGYRLNHYAIKALLARVYLYKGDKTNALKYANELIDLHVNKGFFRWTSQSYISGATNRNVKLYDDVIFALYNNKLMNYEKEENNDPTDNQLRLQDYAGIFGVDTLKDYRHHQWIADIYSDKYIPQKIKEQGLDTKYGIYCNKMIPMLRLSEVYYIAAEANFATNRVLAKSQLQFVKSKRGVSTVLPDVTTQDDFNKQILNEVRRELYGEGQLWYFYKRLNLPLEISEGEVRVLSKEFVFPIPMSNDIN